jgi:hypothetical protein
MIYAISHLLLLPSSPENMTRVHFKVLLHFCSNPSVKGMNRQQKQMTNCIDHLKPGSIAMVMDFSENYGCLFQSEVQSGFFDRNQV